ncbi:Crp/Fnr family transcriptional regulator [Aliifodinibius salicampi]|uniref:Crp/Fnr family transcriptional regulator n=1 Tax=Fodinibius salicampi TaxID=1920655 RepID=A0ABT3Q199_9BACT|nr:Crp/Fnr family transcriptional regulator [Fodinibius salicampi]MCW9713889.1 Crp/Fnr family transcriptional regulator [Fodinibius salicampi]
MHDFLKSLNILTEKEIEQLHNFSTARTLDKGEYFIRENSVCNEIAFINEGILRSYYTNEDAEEITYCITFQNNFMTAYSSLITGKPTPENIQAITDTELLVFQKRDLVDQLTHGSPNWIKLQKHFAEQEYLNLEKRVFSYQKKDAKQRYIDLMETHPRYIQQIPLQYLASYLGITPRHLSRIRQKVTF